MPPTTLGMVCVLKLRVAGILALGREGEEEVAAALQPARLEARQQLLARRARVGGRLEHHQLARAQPRARSRPAVFRT